MKKTIKRKRKDMRVYQDSNGNHTIVEVIINSKNEIIAVGDVEMAVGKDFLSLKQQLFSMFKAIRFNIIDDEYIKSLSDKQKKKS